MGPERASGFERYPYDGEDVQCPARGAAETFVSPGAVDGGRIQNPVPLQFFFSTYMIA